MCDGVSVCEMCVSGSFSTCNNGGLVVGYPSEKGHKRLSEMLNERWSKDELVGRQNNMAICVQPSDGSMCFSTEFGCL